MSEMNEFATVGTVMSSGVTLVFDGEDAATATEKVYKVATGIKLRAGQRVKLAAVDGTYIVLCGVGAPYADYVMPAGGTDGQMLLKDGAADFAVKWGGLPPGLPAGGTDGQVLLKDGSTDYAVKWGAAVHGIPAGGTTGQVLKKSSNAAYAVAWGDVTMESAEKISNGSYGVAMSSGGVLAPVSTTYKIDLGSASMPYTNMYANGTIVLGDSFSGSVKLCGASAKLGFFGVAPVARKSVASSATVATLITALKGYGLIS